MSYDERKLLKRLLRHLKYSVTDIGDIIEEVDECLKTDAMSFISDIQQSIMVARESLDMALDRLNDFVAKQP